VKCKDAIHVSDNKPVSLEVATPQFPAIPQHKDEETQQSSESAAASFYQTNGLYPQ